MELTVIKQGDFKVDKRKNFEYLKPNDESTSIKLAIQPFLITLGSDTILLDLGLGFLEDNEPVILKRLKDQNINPNNITKILLSHLHKDHADGLGYFKENEFVQNFPDAAIYIQKREYDFALQQTENPSYNIPLLNELQKLNNIIWLHDDEGEISPEITFKVTAGHSKFHQVFWIKENDSTIFFGADDLPTTGYLKRSIAYKTDYDGHKAMEFRKIWKEQAEAENWQVLFYHDLKNPVVQF